MPQKTVGFSVLILFYSYLVWSNMLPRRKYFQRLFFSLSSWRCLLQRICLLIFKRDCQLVFLLQQSLPFWYHESGEQIIVANDNGLKNYCKEDGPSERGFQVTGEICMVMKGWKRYCWWRRVKKWRKLYWGKSLEADLGDLYLHEKSPTQTTCFFPTIFMIGQVDALLWALVMQSLFAFLYY